MRVLVVGHRWSAGWSESCHAALRALGHEVFYIEDTGECVYDPVANGLVKDPSYGTSHIRHSLDAFGLVIPAAMPAAAPSRSIPSFATAAPWWLRWLGGFPCYWPPASKFGARTPRTAATRSQFCRSSRATRTAGFGSCRAPAATCG